MKFSIKNFFSKCDQIRSFLRIWSHLLKKYLMENFIFCAVNVLTFCAHNLSFNLQTAEAHLELSQESKMEVFAKIVNGF